MNRRNEAEGVVYQLEKLTDQTEILYQATQTDLNEAQKLLSKMKQ